MIITRLTSKSQTTVPKAVREALGVKAGDRVAFLVQGGQARVIKAPTAEELAFLRLADESFAEEWSSAEDCEAFDSL
jgi:AbrB family looped-hinge helix DNA binding protein